MPAPGAAGYMGETSGPMAGHCMLPHQLGLPLKYRLAGRTLSFDPFQTTPFVMLSQLACCSVVETAVSMLKIAFDEELVLTE